MSNWFRKPKVALALGSGGGKGLSHIGVIKTLEKAGVKIDYIAGSSIGAIVGALYATNQDIATVEKLAIKTNWDRLAKLLDLNFGYSTGLLSGNRLLHFFSEITGGKNFSELKIPLSVVATDINTGEPKIFFSGDLAQALRASASVPLVFSPAVIDNKIYSDGGLSIPVPVQVARDMGADIVIAVDLDASACIYVKPITNAVQMTERVINLLSLHLARDQVKHADIHITPEVCNVGWSAFLTNQATEEAIRLGEKATEEQLTKIKSVTSHPALRIIQKIRDNF